MGDPLGSPRVATLLFRIFFNYVKFFFLFLFFLFLYNRTSPETLCQEASGWSSSFKSAVVRNVWGNARGCEYGPDRGRFGMRRLYYLFRLAGDGGDRFC